MNELNQIEGPVPKSLDWDAIRERDLLTQRFAGYIANPLRSDMHFYIEMDEKIIPAHSFIVGAGSPVLERFVYGSGQLGATKRIPVSNIMSTHFLEVIRFIYTDKAHLNESNALPIMHVAHYYNLKYLEKLCGEAFKLTIRNVCPLYDNVHLLENCFVEDCVRFISTKTEPLIQNDTLIAMGMPAIKKVVNETVHLIGDFELFASMHRYAVTMCKRNGLPINGTNKRKILKERLELLEFAWMNILEFGKCLKMDKELFTANEIDEIMFDIVHLHADAPRTSAIRVKPSTIEQAIKNDVNFKFNPWIILDKEWSEDCIPEEIGKISTIQQRSSVFGFVLIGKDFKISSNGKQVQFKRTDYLDMHMYWSNVLFQPPIVVTEKSPFTFKITYDKDFSTPWGRCITPAEIRRDLPFDFELSSSQQPIVTRIKHIYYK